MYKPKYIKIENIGSIKGLEFDFKTGESQIIQGRNLDDRGQKNNGVGKSFFIDSLSFALTGVALSGRTTEEFIRDGQNSAYIELLLESAATNSNLLIKRKLNRKTPQVIEIILNGVDRHGELPDVNSKNDFIINEIGVSKDDLFQFFLISKDRYKPYFKLSDNDKKLITARFSKANIIDGVFDGLEMELKDLEQGAKLVEDKKIKIETKITSYKEFLEDISKKDSKEYKDSLKLNFLNEIEEKGKRKEQVAGDIAKKDRDVVDLQAKYDEEFSSIDGKYDGEIKEVGALIAGIDEKVAQNELKLKDSIKSYEDDLNSLRGAEKAIRDKERNAQQQLSDVNALISKANAKLRSSINCPKCDHDFILDSDSTVEELKETIDELNVMVGELKGTIEGVSVEISDNKDKINSINLKIDEKRKEFKSLEVELLNEKSKLREKLSELQNLKDSDLRRQKAAELEIANVVNGKKILENELKMLNLNIDNLFKEIENIDNTTLQEDIEKYKALIDGAEKELIEVQEDIFKNGENIRKANEWVLKFKSFKSHLVNLSLKNIQDLINSYLSKMETDLSVEIEGYRQRGKKITERITETILRGGVPVGSYSRYSGGERARIDVGSILANQTLINNNASPKGLDLILIDEVLESSDSLGIENIIKSMETINKTMLLITQNEINALPEKTITFIKQNGELKIA